MYPFDSRGIRIFLPAVIFTAASILILLAVFTGGGSSRSGEHPLEKGIGTAGNAGIAVAAIQFSSRMGDSEWNRKRLLALVAEAALAGAKVVVLPETAVQGYMTPDGQGVWCAPDFPDRDREISLEGIAETVPGPSSWAFGGAAMTWGVYIVAPLIEVDPATGRYFNTAVLLGPHGDIVLHYRKINPWTPAEYGWASEGADALPVVDTPLGRLGLMICFDVHSMLEPLAEAGAELILWPIWWVDPDPTLTFDERLPDLCREHGAALVAANRASRGVEGELPGAGFSRVIGADGRILARARTVATEIVTGTVVLANPRDQRP